MVGRHHGILSCRSLPMASKILRRPRPGSGRKHGCAAQVRAWRRLTRCHPTIRRPHHGHTGRLVLKGADSRLEEAGKLSTDLGEMANSKERRIPWISA